MLLAVAVLLVGSSAVSPPSGVDNGLLEATPAGEPRRRGGGNQHAHQHRPGRGLRVRHSDQRGDPGDEDAARRGHMRYPYIGVEIGDVAKVPPDEKEKLGPNPPDKGALVSEVKEGSPAAKAGLHPGRHQHRDRWPGDLHGGRRDRCGVGKVDRQQRGGEGGAGRKAGGRARTVGELPSPASEVAASEPGPSGMALQTVTPELAQSLGLPAETHGAAVTDVTTGSPAARAGVKPGDVVVEVDRQPIASAEDVATAVQQPRANGHLVRVVGENGSRFVTLPTG